MNWLEITVIALILAVDATVYSFSYGLVLRAHRWASALWLALVVALFQGGMPILGYLGGISIKDRVDAWDHWIVLAVFSALGGVIIYKAWAASEGEEGENPTQGQPLGFIALLLVGIATSIDALAVGACMALGSIGGQDLSVLQLALAMAIIAIITFVCSLAAFHSARLLHHLPTKWLETAAGLLLIGLGLHNCLSHCCS